MFTSNTLLILVAGSSTTYGFPIGTKLIENIINDMNDQILIPKYLSSGFQWNEDDQKNENYYDFDKFKEKYASLKPHIKKIQEGNFKPDKSDIFNHNLTY